MTFSETILKTGVYLPLHPFVAQVRDYFDIIPFQLPPNSHHLIVAFYVVFLEYCGVAPSMAHFAYIYSRPLPSMPDFSIWSVGVILWGSRDCLVIQARGNTTSFSTPQRAMGSSKRDASDRFLVYQLLGGIRPFLFLWQITILSLTSPPPSTTWYDVFACFLRNNSLLRALSLPSSFEGTTLSIPSR